MISQILLSSVEPRDKVDGPLEEVVSRQGISYIENVAVAGDRLGYPERHESVSNQWDCITLNGFVASQSDSNSTSPSQKK